MIKLRFRSVEWVFVSSFWISFFSLKQQAWQCEQFYSELRGNFRSGNYLIVWKFSISNSSHIYYSDYESILLQLYLMLVQAFAMWENYVWIVRNSMILNLRISTIYITRTLYLNRIVDAVQIRRNTDIKLSKFWFLYHHLWFIVVC